MITRKIFLISQLTNASGNSPAKFYVYDGTNLNEHDAFSNVIKDDAVLISFDWDNLVTWLSMRAEPLPTKLVDMEQIAKQTYGHKNLVGEALPWSLWTIVSDFYKPEENEVFVKTQRVYQGLDTVNDLERSQLYFRLLKAMHEAFVTQISKLKELQEYDRFKHVERRIREINLERTYKGIVVDTKNVEDWIEEISHRVYGLRNELQLKHGVISPADWKTVMGKIEDKARIIDAHYIIEEKGYYFFLKDAQNRHPLIKLLYEEKKSSTDLNALLAIGALRPQHKLIIPVYDSFGTITARTKITTPNLQNLSRKYRTIITAEEGKVLVYIDYAQFEAGILADDSNDPLLIEEYNSKYIYDEVGKRIEISRFLPDVEDQKKFCKSLFYKFSYGMDINQNIQILKDFNIHQHSSELSTKIVAAFAAYSKLNEYRSKIGAELALKKKIGTRNGNYRYQFDNEQRSSWAISQRIQGTASLVLKKAIIELNNRDKEIEFLIPMHDAALFQVPNDLEDQKKAIIKSVFESTFEAECPSIKAIADFKPFYDI